MALRLRRGTDADRTSLTVADLAVGELIYTTDTKKLYVGDGATAGGVEVTGSGGSTPGGSDTQVQYNDGGSALGGDAGLTYNAATNTLTVGEGANTITMNGSAGTVSSSSTISASRFIGDGSLLTGVTATNIVGELVGSVFDDASNLIVDGINGHVYPTRLHNSFTTVIGNINYIQGENDASTVTEMVETIDEKSALTLRRKSASDISGSDLTYGTISFQRSDTGGPSTTAIISGTRDKLYLSSDSTATFGLDKFAVLTNGQFIIGGVTPTATLDVRGNAIISGGITGDLTGSVFADDSTQVIDGLTGTVNLANTSITSLSDVSSATPGAGQVLKWTGTQWAPAADAAGSGGAEATITNATQANPVVITTSAAHNFADTTYVTITGVVGMTELNGNSYYINVLTTDTFALYTDAALTSSVDGSAYTAYTSDGTAAPLDSADAATFNGEGPAYYLEYANFTNTPTLAAVATSGAYGDLSGTPTISAFGATLIDDADAGTARTTLGLGSAATTASTAYATAAQGTLADTALQPADIGSFTLSGSTLDTSDSSGITITPAVTMNSDLTVENDLRVTNVVYADSFVNTGGGTPTMSSASNLDLQAGDRVRVTQSPFRLAYFTNTERDALSPVNGDMIYNTTTNQVQAYIAGAWRSLDNSAV